MCVCVGGNSTSGERWRKLRDARTGEDSREDLALVVAQDAVSAEVIVAAAAAETGGDVTESRARVEVRSRRSGCHAPSWDVL